jgi:2,3-bisphosphoglycerate-independent phosphoglycerate mutase
MIKSTKKAFLMVLDGYGLCESRDGNAVKLANTPYLHEILPDRPQATLSASGRDVGLPEGRMGNSEVGHLNIGAGRIVYQELSRIDLAIERGEFFANPMIKASVDYASRNSAAWHLFGLVSDGGVHSSLNHLYALLELARQTGLQRVYLHAITDGRDTPPHSGIDYLRQVEAKMRELGVGQVATVSSRYWGMDRDNRWPRIEKCYRMMVEAEGLQFAGSEEAIADSYRREVTDEFIEPSVLMRDGKPVATIKDGDAIFFFNFRADRARQMIQALTVKDFPHFPRRPLDLHYATMTQYHSDYSNCVAFPPQRMTNILGEVLSDAGLKQFRIAETEKYAHVTFFFNGGNEVPYPGEERVLIQSPKVATYDLQPSMSAPAVAERALQALDKDYDFFMLNFANPDMVGHTGVLSAAIAALETIDPLVEQIVAKAQFHGYALLITSDHGNCEKMIDDDGGPHTAHTTNRVPLAIILPEGSRPKLRQDGILADLAPTILKLMKIPQPPEMEGRSLIL